eukprot:Nitzschia sp. Nitz4//scaffold46_size129759//49937//53329//NITZ4_003499-RA/size129759-snap-gene-0.24-mRNA-1//-1//CDS//3329552589//2136//frame0
MSSYNHEFPQLAASNPSGRQSYATQVAELANPIPQSLILGQVLMLLEPLEDTQSDVFLMTRSYLQNWLIWAFHERVLKTEKNRLTEGLRLAASRHGLTPPQPNMYHTDPGPIDASILSVEGHPLLLRPNVIVKDEFSDAKRRVPEALQRVKSYPDESERKLEPIQDAADMDSLDMDGEHWLCCAVPLQFYESLREHLGVVCSDGLEVSCQPYLRDSPALLHHHLHTVANAKIAPDHSHPPGSNGKLPIMPIEFRRRILFKPAPIMEPNLKLAAATSPMSKLMADEQQRNGPRFIPTVEVYPMKLNFKVVDHNRGVSDSKELGFVLASRRDQTYQILQSLLKVAAPQTSSGCRRLWCKRDSPGTQNPGDGYELIDLAGLDGKLLPKDAETGPSTPDLTLDDWCKSFGDSDIRKELDLLVEIRRSNDDWPRQSMEFENRVQVGDFCDAQDTAGKWFEALVKEVNQDTIVVHYLGWTSRWDATIRRRGDSPVGEQAARIRQPVPLWTHCRRWRVGLTEGQRVEVRDTLSLSTRPRWYMGIVRRVGTPDGKPVAISGGAELELFESINIPTVDGEEPVKEPLLLLRMLQQIMVEVEDEKPEDPSMNVASIPSIADNVSMDTVEAIVAEPPFLRWVNLYGEEICQPGTHLRVTTDTDPVPVTLQYEFEPHRKPVEIMKPFNSFYGQGFMKESLVGTPPAPGAVGMHNLGNSCFLNSIIQCLNHIEPLTQYFLTGNYSKDMNRQNPLGSGGKVANAYASLLQKVWSGKYSALAPRLLKQTVASFAPQFNNSYQHDSQEFCQFLMDGLHEDCNRVQEKPYVEELEGFGMEDSKAAIETWRKHLLRHDSVIVDHFQGMHRSHLTCPSCSRESIKFDVYSTISVPIVSDKNSADIKLEDCIEKFLEGEQLDDLNAWYCPNCKKHVCALKMIALWSVPDILVFHLKRFQFDHCEVRNTVVRSKITDTVKFPIDYLDMRRHVLGPVDEDAPPIYKLFGVSEHQGPTANSGHYTATVRNSKDGRWHRYNDANVGNSTGDAAVTPGAYLLFYQRQRGKARWAGMEKVMQERGIDPYGGLEVDQDGFVSIKKKKKKP